MNNEQQQILQAVIESKTIAAGFRSHAKELLEGRDPSGGMVSKEAQLNMLKGLIK